MPAADPTNTRPPLRRRNTAYLTRQSSVILTNEARGEPFKVLSLVFAAVNLAFGLRDIFFCGTPFNPGDPMEVEVLALIANCDTDMIQGAYSGMIGVGMVAVSGLRITVATAKHVGELYRSVLALVVVDVLTAFVLLRAGRDVVPVHYFVIFAVLFPAYEAWVLVDTRRMHQKRIKAKQV